MWLAEREEQRFRQQRWALSEGSSRSRKTDLTRP
jgi:hypothetical protein